MHAVVVRVTVNDPEASIKALNEQIVPTASQFPGFVAGYWTRKDNVGVSMIIFESEDAATEASERVPSLVTDAVNIDDIEVREVVAHA